MDSKVKLPNKRKMEYAYNSGQQEIFGIYQQEIFGIHVNYPDAVVIINISKLHFLKEIGLIDLSYYTEVLLQTHSNMALNIYYAMVMLGFQSL